MQRRHLNPAVLRNSSYRYYCWQLEFLQRHIAFFLLHFSDSPWRPRFLDRKVYRFSASWIADSTASGCSWKSCVGRHVRATNAARLLFDRGRGREPRGQSRTPGPRPHSPTQRTARTPLRFSKSSVRQHCLPQSARWLEEPPVCNQ